MMKRINVICLNNVTKESFFEEIDIELDKQEKHSIDNLSWDNYQYKPSVEFTVGYNDCIFLKYYVKENTIRAKYNKSNDPVYKDSCVEFFVSFDDTGYYNLEFNCIGTCLAGFRTDSSNKKRVTENTIEKIRTKSMIKKTGFANSDWQWELTLVIPLEVFEFHQFTSLKDTKCSANFYKCGDDLPQPHYLSWSKIKSDKPNFHLPEFFGEINFK